MKKFKITLQKFLVVVCVLLAGLAMFCGCNSGNNAKLATPTELTLDKKGVLSWTATEGTSYEISVDNQTWKAVEDGNEANLLDIVTSTATTKVYVRATQGSKKGEAAEFALTVEKLPTPEKPEKVVDEETHSMRIEWAKVSDADKYEVKVNDGNWTTSSKAYYVPNKTGDYVVTVRCKGFADDGVLYLASDSSVSSDSIKFVEAPALSVPNINVLACSSSVVFDSYNLWINKSNTAEKWKVEDVEFDEGQLNLVIGETPVLTETGEYDIQLEAIVDGVSWWSEMLYEVGTSNINENELFSFDNRNDPQSPTTRQTAVSVSNEHYLGKAEGKVGYSLKIDGSEGRLKPMTGLVKYAASGLNEIDFRNVTKVSYWVYLPSGQVDAAGNEVTALSDSQLPMMRYEENVQTADGESEWAAQSFFPIGYTVPADTWTKITLNVENMYDHILTFVTAYVSENNLVVYLDDFTYDVITDRSQIIYPEANQPAGTEYVLKYTNLSSFSGAWYGLGRVKLSFGEEYANKRIMFRVDVMGTAPAVADQYSLPNLVTHKTLIGDKASDGSSLCLGYYGFPKGTVTQMSEWKTVSFNTLLNENGDVYVNVAGQDNNNRIEEEFLVYMKNVQMVTEGIAAEVNFDWKYTDFKHMWIAIPVAESVASVGDTVTITMDMFIKPEGCEYEDKPIVVNSIDGKPQVATFGMICEGETWKDNELNQWHTFTFQAVVLDADAIRKDAYNPNIELPDGQYVLLFWSSAGVGNTDAVAEWYYKAPTAIVKVEE